MFDVRIHRVGKRLLACPENRRRVGFAHRWAKPTLHGNTAAIGLMLICLLLATLPARAVVGPSTQPVSAADQASESTALRISPGEIQAASNRSSGASATTSPTADLSRIAIALAVVICLILLLRAGVRHLTAGHGGGRGSKLVTVLSRSIVSPKQQVLVLQVGKRLLVVGDSAGHMSALCEITDPDEIASLVGQTRQGGSSTRTAGSFGSLFRRANEPFTETEILQSHQEEREEQGSDMNSEDGVSSEEVGGLLDKVRMLQQQFNESKQQSGLEIKTQAGL